MHLMCIDEIQYAKATPCKGGPINTAPLVTSFLSLLAKLLYTFYKMQY